MPPIPSSRLILTDLILQLKASAESCPSPSNEAVPNQNPLSARQDVRGIVVALEYLVPGGVTAALSVLDKGLVTRYCLKAEGKTESRRESAGEKVEQVAEGKLKTDEEPREPAVDREIPGSPTGSVSEMDETVETPAAEREIPGTPNGSDSEISDVVGEQDDPKIAESVPSGGEPVLTQEETEACGEAPKSDDKYAYYVRSEQPPSSKWSKKPPRPTPTYSVRPTAWFCSCSTFLYAAFAVAPGPVTTSRYPDITERNKKARKRWEAEEFSRVWDMMETHGWVWGGRMLGIHAPPVCKHLLACVLAENCGDLFMPFVNRVELDLEELVGMSANIRRI